MAEMKTKPIPHMRGKDKEMENDQVINTIQALLEGSDTITPQVSAKLTLAVVSQLYVMMQGIDKKIDDSIHQSMVETTAIKADIDNLKIKITLVEAEQAAFRSDIKDLRDTDIILWAQKHPKMATATAAVMYLIAVFSVELKDYIFTLLGFHF